jgi:putative hydrolase
MVDPDPNRVFDSLRGALSSAKGGRRAIEDGGLVHLFATPDQRAVLNRIGGLMSLLEGHGDVTMNRAAAGRVPSAERFARVLRERRRSGGGIGRLFQRLLGIEAKLAQYEAGEQFIARIEAVGGRRAIDRCWARPENLPTLDEIRAPEQWLARVGVDAAVA